MIIDGLSVDLLHKTDFKKPCLDLAMFLSTLIIIQYDLVLGFWCYLKNSNHKIICNKSFIDNNLLQKDLSQLIQETQKIVADNNYARIINLRDFGEERYILKNELNTLSFALAFGKVLFLSRNKVIDKNSNRKTFLLISEFRKFYTGLIRNPQKVMPGICKNDLLNLDPQFTLDLISNMRITKLPANLLKTGINMNIVEKYGRGIDN